MPVSPGPTPSGRSSWPLAATDGLPGCGHARGVRGGRLWHVKARQVKACHGNRLCDTRSPGHAVVGKTVPVTFGQASGPSATARQLRELLVLLNEAGHSDYRDARGPMGFTQRQAGGRFTRDEAEQYISRLEGSRSAETSFDGAPPTAPVSAAPTWRPPRRPLLIEMPAEQLADELRRRGWTVAAPT